MEDTKADIVEAPQEPMPSSDQQQQVSEPTEPSLPEGVSDRTAKEFEKLKAENRKLKELADERARRQSYESVFTQIGAGAYQQPQPDEALFDPNTGEIYAESLENLKNRTLTAEQRAARAEQAVNKIIEDQQTREAVTVHPELDVNSDSFNETFYKATRALMLDSIVNPNDYGKQLTYKEAADFAKTFREKDLVAAEQAGAEKALEQLTPKEQAALEATGRSDRRTEVDYEELSFRTQRGDYDAIISRLKKIPPVAR